jgi:hypothetical protein
LSRKTNACCPGSLKNYPDPINIDQGKVTGRKIAPLQEYAARSGRKHQGDARDDLERLTANARSRTRSETHAMTKLLRQG